jgi:hypothetical protein
LQRHESRVPEERTFIVLAEELLHLIGGADHQLSKRPIAHNVWIITGQILAFLRQLQAARKSSSAAMAEKASAIKALMNPPVDEPQNPSILFDFLDLFSLVIFEVSILRNTN